MFGMDGEENIRAWQSTDNDAAKFKAGISGDIKGERHHFANALK